MKQEINTALVMFGLMMEKLRQQQRYFFFYN